MVLAAGSALVAASARAQGGQVVLAPTVYATHDLPSNAVTTFTAICPPLFVATSAGVTAPAPGTTVLAITPVGARGYRFRLGNPVTNADQRVTVAVACRKLPLVAGKSKLTLKLKPLKTRYLVVPPAGAAAATLTCPRGTIPAGAGVDLDPNRQKAVGAYRVGPPLSIRRQTQTLQRLVVVVGNGGLQARRVAVHGGCVTVVRAAGAPRQRLHVRLTTFRVLVPPGRQVFSRRCRAGWFSLGTGYSLRAKAVTSAGAAAIDGGGRWVILSDASPGPKADLQLACAHLAP